MVRTHAPPARARLYVVRHADAGIRGHGADDHLRPLSRSGRARARRLADLLESTPFGDIVSSPYVRCVQTVEPLAERRGTTIALSDDLAEGASIDATLRLLRVLPSGSVVCTHGDLLGHLAAYVAVADGRVGQISYDKGGIWVLAREGDTLSIVEQMRASRCLDDRPVMMTG